MYAFMTFAFSFFYNYITLDFPFSFVQNEDDGEKNIYNGFSFSTVKQQNL